MGLAIKLEKLRGVMIGNDILANNPLWIVDVGASGGMDPIWARFTSSYKGILFEPDPSEYDKIKSQNSKNLIVLNSVLSDSAGTVDFHSCKKQEVSSIYLPNIDFLGKFPDVKRFDVRKHIRMKADTLNGQLKKNNIYEIDFIKIDAQGYGLPILKGGVDYLDNAIGLELEVEFASLYEKESLFGEVDCFVRGYGFELFDIKRYYWKRKECVNTGNQKGQLVFGDALYFKGPEQVLLMNGLTEEKIIRSICVYLVYGYLDLAQTLSYKSNRKGLLTKESHDKVVLILSKYEKRNRLPNFWGKGRMQRLFESMGNVLSDSSWLSGRDKSLGNG
jgi:FkbM family methyltransferase